MYVCVHVYIYICIYIYVHVCIYIYIHIDILIIIIYRIDDLTSAMQVEGRLANCSCTTFTAPTANCAGRHDHWSLDSRKFSPSRPAALQNVSLHVHRYSFQQWNASMCFATTYIPFDRPSLLKLEWWQTKSALSEALVSSASQQMLRRH